MRPRFRDERRDPEVEDLHSEGHALASRRFEEDVVGFQVAVDDAEIVGRAECVAKLRHHLAHEPARKRPFAAHEGGDRLALQKLHREPRHAARLVDAGIDDFDDVLALDLRADLRLLREALAELLVADELWEHHLQRAQLLRGDLFDEVNGAHAALRQRANDAVAGNHGAVGEVEIRHHKEILAWSRAGAATSACSAKLMVARTDHDECPFDASGFLVIT